jgi:cysteine synthase A
MNIRWQGSPSMQTESVQLATLETRFSALHRLVGNTPLLAVDVWYRGEFRRVFAKLESLSLTGSVKDRMALFVLEEAYRQGRLRPGDRIVEATSGNTGISFAAIGRALGHPVTIFMPDWMSPERISLIGSFGADIVPVSRQDGGFLGSIERADAQGRHDPGVFLPHQFSNEANVQAHFQTTGPEIWAQMTAAGVLPAVFVAGVGTGGTVMGAGRYLRQCLGEIRVHPVEPAESPTLSTGRKTGQHRIQGISDEFIPPIVKLDELDEVIAVHDGDAILMAQQLARHGLAVGISSGANFVAALKAQTLLGGNAPAVTMFSDSNKKYLSTDLLRSEPTRPDYETPHVEILGYSAFSRSCDFCAR